MSNMNRRNFFRVGAGAAAAAPVAMKQVVSDLAGPGNVPMPPIGGFIGGLNATGADSSYAKHELAEALKQMASIDTAKPDHERYLEAVIAQRIDGLRSVSAVNKARMMTEERERLELLRRKGWLQQRIDRLKEQLGPLGQLL